MCVQWKRNSLGYGDLEKIPLKGLEEEEVSKMAMRSQKSGETLEKTLATVCNITKCPIRGALHRARQLSC